MSYVQVVIVTPNDGRFTASIDIEADPELLLKQLVEELHLPPKRYELHLLNALKLQDGVVIKIDEHEPRSEAIKLVE